jgi:hypothetical protein
MMTTTTGTGSGGTPIQVRAAMLVLAVIIFLLAFGYAFHIDFGKHYFIGGFSSNAFGYVLALLPGAAALGHYLSATYNSRQRGVPRLQEFSSLRAKLSGQSVDNDLLLRMGESPSVAGTALGAAFFLTASFVLVASICDTYGASVNSQAPRPVDGIIFAGFGAYVSVIYYMTARMYANSLSSRFLTASALRSASTIAFGWVAVRIGLTNILPSTSAIGALFLCGLFYSWALSSLRTKAMTWFGAPKTDNEELPVGIVEGVDDTTEDLLSEYGVTTVQHLTTSDPSELTQRTLIPIDRIVDWIDQANLIQVVKRNIVALRAAGIRSASDLAQTEDKLLKPLAEKAGMSADMLTAIAARFAADFDTRLFFEFKEGRALPARASVTIGGATTTEARIPVKENAAATSTSSPE